MQSSSPPTWHCLEWELGEPTGSAASETAVWLGATELGSVHLTSLPVPADLGALRFGIYIGQTSGQPEYDLWLDDIVVDTQRVDCGVAICTSPRIPAETSTSTSANSFDVSRG